MREFLLESPPVVLSILVAAAVFLLVVGFLNLLRPRFERLTTRMALEYDQRFVDQLAFTPLRIEVFQLATVLLIVVCGLSLMLLPLGNGFLLAAFLVIAATVGPVAAYVILRAKRRKQIDKVLPNVLQQMAANFRTTNDISRALAEVAETAPAPMDHELLLIRQKEKDLQSFPEALDQARRRIGSDWFDVVAAVLRTTYENGGKESDALMNLSRVFVQLTKMRDRLDTATSQGRMTMKIIMAMPFLVVLIAMIAVPDIAAGAWESFVGKFMLGMATLVYIAAVALAIWLTSVKV